MKGYILGLSCFYHDSSAVITKGSEIIAAIQEERVTRIKFDNSFPINAINECLKIANITINDIDEIPKLEQISQIIEIVDNLLEKGPLLIHCFAGIERSPLISILWLTKKHKLKFQQALDYMMQVHPGTNPLSSQLKVLDKLFI